MKKKVSILLAFCLVTAIFTCFAKPLSSDRTDANASTLGALVERVEKAGDIDAVAFKDVKIDRTLIDLVVSSDDVAVLFAVYPEECDYVAVPRGKRRNLSASNELSATKLDIMAVQRDVLRELEKDADIHLAIIAGAKTLSSMRSVWGDELATKGVELVGYKDFENYLRKYLPLLPEPPRASDNEPDQFKKMFDEAYAAYKKNDYDKSFPIFMKLAENGFEKAFGYVGLAYELGEGVGKDIQKAIAYYEKAIAAHDHLGVYRLGPIYVSRGQHEKAFGVYESAAKGGFASSGTYLKLAKMLEKGEGTHLDLQKAIAYYRTALSLSSNDPFNAREAREALERLGVLYSAEDFKMQLPEELQNSSAEKLYTLGIEHRDDFEHPNIPLAFACLHLAADKGHALAASKVSVLYSSRKYPIKNDEEAKRYARQAADGMLAQVKANPDYANEAGYAYEHGHGCDQDEGKAVQCYKIGVKAKDKNCEWRLAGIIQRNGQLAEAFQLFLDSAKHGQGMAMFEVAHCLEHGIGTTRNVEQAIYWYGQCAKSTYAAAHDAERKLRELNRR